MGAVGDREIFARGTPESIWQDSGILGRIPLVSPTALCPAGSRAVIIAPHPDDEILAAAGLMMQLAELGRDILIIGVTEGDASHPGSRIWSPSTLARRRSAERHAAMQALGLGQTPVVRLEISDGKVEASRLELAQHLDAILLPTDLVFTTWRLDGHPDHEAVGRAAATCCRHIGTKMIELPVWMWHWATPQDSRIPWDRAIGLALTEAQLELKREAIAAHTTQLDTDASLGAEPILPTWVLDRLLRPIEVFFR